MLVENARPLDQHLHQFEQLVCGFIPLLPLDLLLQAAEARRQLGGAGQQLHAGQQRGRQRRCRRRKFADFVVDALIVFRRGRQLARSKRQQGFTG